MARVFTWGFETKWRETPVSTSDFSTFNTVDPRGGYTHARAGAFFGNNSTVGAHVTYAFPAEHSGDECWFRIAIRRGNTSLWLPDLKLEFSDGTIFLWELSNTGNIRIDGNIIGTAVVDDGTVTENWHLLEVHFVVGASGRVDAKHNNQLVLDNWNGALSASGEKLSEISFVQREGRASFHIDDIGLNDATGSENNSWLGNTITMVLLPNANGDLSEWVGSDGDSVDNYLLIDESGDANESDYVLTGTDGKKDLYHVQPLESILEGNTIRNVFITSDMKKTNTSEAARVRFILKMNSENIVGDAEVVESTKTIYSNVLEKNPETNNDWSLSDIANLQIGIEKIAP